MCLLVIVMLLAGCNLTSSQVRSFLYEKGKGREKPADVSTSDYYESFYKMGARYGGAKAKEGTNNIAALEALPKDPFGNVNWTLAVLEGYINPKGSLDPDEEEEEPLNLNVFIEAKVPLMHNVIFPHSIHTYWLSCGVCHPGIFIPEAGANPISMYEIFEGKWCGRCHGKVAFPPMVEGAAKGNCNRCHVIPKGQSRERERW
jgi:c(7)-type cytochrome triheme protein